MTNPRSALAELVASDQPEAAMYALDAAIGWAAESAEADLADSKGRAIRVIVALDSALAGGARLFAAVPRLLSLADPGPAVTELIRQREAQLVATAAKIKEFHRELAALTAAEERLTELVTEADRLESRITALRELEARASEVDDLRLWAEQLAERTGSLATVVTAAEASVDLATRQFTASAPSHLELLHAQSRADLDLAIEQARQLAAARRERDERMVESDRLGHEVVKLEADLELARLQFEQLAAGHEHLTTQVRRHAEADREIAAALAHTHTEAPPDIDRRTALDAVTSALATVEGMLTGVDDALARALQVHEADRAAQHAKRYLAADARE
jgi:chromosome segregation ATPase